MIIRENPKIFHINKQIALEAAKFDWILQLDADERVSGVLVGEIKRLIGMSEVEIAEYQKEVMKNKLFIKHTKLIEKRDGKVGKDGGEYGGFFVPRRNYFLGKYLRYGGTYPDGVIRLVKNGKASFPCKSVHEQIEIDGRVGWLENDLLHKDSPTFKRYLEKNSKYINLIVSGLKKDKLRKNMANLINYMIVKPTAWFLMTTV